MSGQWKPGDVALRSYLGNEERSMRVTHCNNNAHQVGPHWHHEGGGWNRSDGFSTYRPLVVIDPEDSRSAAIEIAQAVGSALNLMPGRDISSGIKAAQDALARLAAPTPPLPDEPTGLGAVIEDADGDVWVRGPSSTAPIEYRTDWVNSDGDFVKWDDVVVARVISEGVVTA